MSETRERCAVCDFPLATEDDYAAFVREQRLDDDAFEREQFGGLLCWSGWWARHRGPVIDWRARALEAAGALDVLEDKYAMLRHSNDAAEARVEALEGALRAADYRLGEVSNYLGPFDHALMFRALSETIAQVRAALSATRPATSIEPSQLKARVLDFAKNRMHALWHRELDALLDACLVELAPVSPAPRPDATEALRVAMEALESVLRALSDAGLEDCCSVAVEQGRTALELLRAHVEPTPLETAVLAHTEKETP